MAGTGQNLTLRERAALEISGVTEVESFDNESIELTTSLGGLQISGSALKIDTLNLTAGQVAISGVVDSLQYGKSRAERSARHKGKSVLNRLLK